MDLNLQPPKASPGGIQNFHIHRFQPPNYELICKWWKKRNFTPPQFEHIPPTGFIVSFGPLQICAGFLCKTDSNVAVVCHLVSNPECDKDMRQSSIDFLIKFMCEKAKEENFTMVMFSTNIEKLGRRVEKTGFIKCDSNVNVYGRLF
jgi:hypothetical protein